MRLSQIYPKLKVAYIPGHADGDINHPDVEFGIVSSKNHVNAFVKFDKQLRKFGWDGTTSQSCSPEDLFCYESTHKIVEPSYEEFPGKPQTKTKP